LQISGVNLKKINPFNMSERLPVISHRNVALVHDPKVQQLLSRIDLPVIREHQDSLLSIGSSDELDVFLQSISDQRVEDQILLSQAAFLSLPGEVPLESWSHKASSFIGYIMAISGHTRSGKMRIHSKDVPESLRSFVLSAVSENMDYQGVLISLLEDFNYLATQGHADIVRTILFNLVVISLDVDKNIDLGHREGWYQLLQERAIQYREGYNNMTDGWMYERKINSIDEIDLDSIEDFEPISERQLELLNLSHQQVELLINHDEFLPEDFHTNRLIRAMFKCSGFSADVAVDVLNYFCAEKEDLLRKKLNGMISRAKLLMTKKQVSVHFAKMAKELKELTGLNMKIWSQIHKILEQSEAESDLNRVTTRVTADVKQIGEPDSMAQQQESVLDSVYNFQDFMDVLDED